MIAYLWRMGRRSLLYVAIGLMLGYCVNARAEGVVARGPGGTVTIYFVDNDHRTDSIDKLTTCQIGLTLTPVYKAPQFNFTAQLFGGGGTHCRGYDTAQSYQLPNWQPGINSFQQQQQGACPANSTDTAGQCVCTAEYKPDGAATACIPDCVAGELSSAGYYRQGPDPMIFPMLQCAGVCEVVFGGFTGMGSTMESGVKIWYALGQMDQTGEACQAGEPMADTPDAPGEGPPPPTCASGQTLGTVNGKPVCATAGDNAPPATNSEEGTEETTKETNPDGSTTETTNRERTWTNPDGSVGKETTTETRTCDVEGNCSSQFTKETEGAPEAGDEPAAEDEEPGPDECEEAPDKLGCKELGEPPAHDKEGLWTHRTVDMAQETLPVDTVGSCPAGHQWTIAGHSLSWDYQQMCDVAPLVRVGILLLAAMSAIGIVMKGAK